MLEVDSILDVTRQRRGRAIRSNPSGCYYTFKEGEKWPCRYHLDILAHTSAWKTEENIKIIADAVSKLMKTDHPELIGLAADSWVGYRLGTLGCFPSQGLTIKRACVLPSPISIEYRDKAECYDLEYLEWFARCGIVPYIPALQEAVKDIVAAVDEAGVCNIPVIEDAFKGWGPYAGMQLEVDWKNKISKDCDVTFRALLILHYAEWSC